MDADEKQFLLWFTRLKTTLEVIPTQDSDVKELRRVIAQVLQKSDMEKKRWSKNIDKETLSLLFKQSDDIKAQLRNVTFPHPIEDYLGLRSGMPTGPNAGFASLRSLQVAPNSRDRRENFSIVHDFLISIAEQNRDALIGACKLADINYRMDKAISRDEKEIERVITKEKRKYSRIEKHSKQRTERLHQLDYSTNSSLNKLAEITKNKVDGLKKNLDAACAEEEAARKALEMALEKKKRAVDMIQDSLYFETQLDSHRRKLFAVNKLLSEMDKANRYHSSNILSAFGAMKKVVETIAKKNQRGEFITDLPWFLNSILKLFGEGPLHQKLSPIEQQDLVDSSQETSKVAKTRFHFIVARIGIELTRLWRQANISANPHLEVALQEFETLMRQQLPSLVGPLPEDPEHGGYYRRFDNTTVVLYFDHLLHKVPENHVESPSRVSTCLKVLSSQRQTIPGVKDLRVVSGESIVAPPLWLLPLVHSPNYMQKLQKLSDATRMDRLVAVEAERDDERTASESDNDDLYATDDEMTSKRLVAKKPIKMEKLDIPPSIRDTMNPEEIEHFEKVMTPTPFEVSMLSILPDLQNISALKPSIAKVPDVGFACHERIMTPFGTAIVLEECPAQRNIIPVYFPWYAKGFLDKASVRKLRYRDTSNLDPNDIFTGLLQCIINLRMRTAVASILPSTLSSELLMHFSTQLNPPNLRNFVQFEKEDILLWTYKLCRLSINATLNNPECPQEFRLFEPYRADSRNAAFELMPPIEIEASLPNRVALHQIVDSYKRSSTSSSANPIINPIESKNRNNIFHMINSPKVNKPQIPSTAMPPLPAVNRRHSLELGVLRPSLEMSIGVAGSGTIASTGCNEEDSLRKLCMKVMRSHGVSQNSLAITLSELFQTSMTQAVMSSWFHARLRGPSQSRLNVYLTSWLSKLSELLNSEETALVRSIGVWAKSKYEVCIGKGFPFESQLFVEHNNENHLVASLLFKQGESKPYLDDISDISHEVANKFKTNDSRKIDEATDGDGAASAKMDIDDQDRNQEKVSQEALQAVSLVKNTEDLRMLVTRELKRRNANPSVATNESNVHEIGVVHSLVTRFLAKDQLSMSFEEVAKNFCRYLLVWYLKSSKLSPGESIKVPFQGLPIQSTNATNGDKSSGDFESSTHCSLCGRSREEFQNERSYRMHTNWCKRRKAMSDSFNNRDESSAAARQKPSIGDESMPQLKSVVDNKPRDNTATAPAPITASTVEASNELDQDVMDESQVDMSDDSDIASIDDDEMDTHQSKRIRIEPIRIDELEADETNNDASMEVVDGDVPVERQASEGILAEKIADVAPTSTSLSQLSQSSVKSVASESTVEQLASHSNPVTKSTSALSYSGGLSQALLSHALIANSPRPAVIIKSEEGECPRAPLSSTLDVSLQSVGPWEPYPAARYFPGCEVCRDSPHSLNRLDPLIPCATCPCNFHKSCGVANPSGESHCPRCIECNVQHSEVLTKAQVRSGLVGSWILLFSVQSRRWRLFYVLKDYPESPFVYLTKAIRVDGKGGKSSLLNLSATLVRTIPSQVAMELSKGANTSLTSTDDLTKIGAVKKSLTKTKGSNSGIGGGISSNGNGAAGSNGIKGRGRGRPRKRSASEDDDSSSDESEVIHRDEMGDTFLSTESLLAALCTSGCACRAVDIVVANNNANVFVCTRPPGHHSGRYGSADSESQGFCLLNNAAMALYYARTRWGMERVAVVDIDVHFGNGTRDILKNDPRAFFASVHMIHGHENNGHYSERGHSHGGKDHGKPEGTGFYPSRLGTMEVENNYVSVGVFPEKMRAVLAREQHQTPVEGSPVATGPFFGSSGYRAAISDYIVPKLIEFNPELLIISAGFDGYRSDPLGSELQLSLDDYSWATKQLLVCPRVVSLLEGGYDTSNSQLGLARCVDEHVRALRSPSSATTKEGSH